VTIIGAVSPPGGDFSEPVTQHTKRFVRCFWGLDRQLANARHYPAISWLDSYSEYLEDVKPWWEERVGPTWASEREEIMELLQKEVRLLQVVKLVGPDALPDSQRFVIEVCTMFKNAFLQQNSFDDVDRYSTIEKQLKMLSIIMAYWHRGQSAIKARRDPGQAQAGKGGPGDGQDEVHRGQRVARGVRQDPGQAGARH
jgi:V/A-type H+/Na+-transporting ATPase subunit A